MILDVKEAPDGELYIEFPEGTLPQGWEVGTVVDWVPQEDGSWLIRKKEMNFVNQVLEFNKIAGTGGEFDARKVALYIGLVLEEASELIESIPDHNGALRHLFDTLDVYSTEFKQGVFDDRVEDIDRVEALDAFVDIAVVALGGACAQGADVEGACDEVMISNLSKFPIGEDGRRYALKDENGKVKKSADYIAPNLVKYANAK